MVTQVRRSPGAGRSGAERRLVALLVEAVLYLQEQASDHAWQSMRWWVERVEGELGAEIKTGLTGR